MVQLAGLPVLAALVQARQRRRGPLGRQTGKMATNQIHNCIVVECPSRGHHDIRCSVMALHIACKLGAGHRLDDLFGSEHGPAHWLARKGGLLEPVEDDVVGRIVGLSDLLQDYAALALDFLGGKDRMAQYVADYVGRERGVFLQDLKVEGGLLAGGIGIDMAADRLDLFGDLRR